MTSPPPAPGPLPEERDADDPAAAGPWFPVTVEFVPSRSTRPEPAPPWAELRDDSQPETDANPYPPGHPLHVLAADLWSASQRRRAEDHRLAELRRSSTDRLAVAEQRRRARAARRAHEEAKDRLTAAALAVRDAVAGREDG